jgi:glycerol-3-phosphate cytidylyltransferase
MREAEGFNVKDAMIIGGSKGLGHALAQFLEAKGFRNIYILDVVSPDTTLKHARYHPFDMSKDALSILDTFVDIDTLIITAGIGHLAPFDLFTDVEIQKTFQVNTISVIKIIRYFYSRLKSKNQFYCAIVTSISGMVSSPLFSLYSATKSALIRFIESINIELEKEKSPNRILNICPGFLNGTAFYGKQSDFTQLREFVEEIHKKMLNRDTFFIPKYNEIYKDVLDRYLRDAHQFGIESYEYKINSKRMVPASAIKTGYLSGTFDLFHVGHLNLLRRAKEYCDFLVVGIHKDTSHKGKPTFIPFDERCTIVQSIKYVDMVIESKPEDSDAYDSIKYDYLFVGSDYKGTDRFNRYEEYFRDKNVKIVYFPYTQETSSTKLRSILDIYLNRQAEY